MEIFKFQIEFHWNVYLKIKLALVHVMAWYQTDDKLLSEPERA